MSSLYRPNRKATDAEILELNSLGLSLSTIGEKLGCHPTTVTLRLKSLNVRPADTRRAFMEDIFNDMSPSQQKWLTSQVAPHTPIKDFVANLILQKFIASGDGKNPSNPSEISELKMEATQ